jgi:hypothetical protein
MKGLRLDISLGRRDSFDGMEDTYRREGLTVGSDYMRIHGVDFNVSVDGHSIALKTVRNPPQLTRLS